MFTVCPKCTLTLVVTTVDLRAGQGYVRCGRCANVFNALIALREGEPNGTTSDTANRRLQETAPPVPTRPALGSGVEMDPEPEPEPAPEPEAQPEPEVAAPEESSLEFDASSTDVSEIFISPPEAEHDSGSGNYEAVVLGEEPQAAPAETPVEDDPAHTDTIAADEWSLLDDEPIADAESVIEESPVAEPDPAWVQEMFAEAEADAERARTGLRRAAPEFIEEVAAQEPAPSAEPPEVEELEPPEDAVEAARASTGAAPPTDTSIEPLLADAAPARPRWQYAAGVALLAIVLALQLVHFNRQALVLSNSFGAAITDVYGWFGVTLVPRWDLAAYSVKQLGAEAEGAEGTRLRVRLSLQNESARVQPLPLLRLTLQDRYGNAVATRDLEPLEYLPSPAAGQRLLEPDQRIDAELHVIDPGRAAIGFEIDACLRGENGTIGCANDARRRAAG